MALKIWSCPVYIFSVVGSCGRKPLDTEQAVAPGGIQTQTLLLTTADASAVK